MMFALVSASAEMMGGKCLLSLFIKSFFTSFDACQLEAAARHGVEFLQCVPMGGVGA